MKNCIKMKTKWERESVFCFSDSVSKKTMTEKRTRRHNVNQWVMFLSSSFLRWQRLEKLLELILLLQVFDCNSTTPDSQSWEYFSFTLISITYILDATKSIKYDCHSGKGLHLQELLDTTNTWDVAVFVIEFWVSRYNFRHDHVSKSNSIIILISHLLLHHLSSRHYLCSYNCLICSWIDSIRQ